MYEVGSRRTINKSGWFFVLLILSGLVLISFYGCQLFQPKTEPVSVDDRVPMDRRIGIIKSLGGVKTSNQGTHLLQLDDGYTILLKSLQINLDDPQYLGKTVEVRGLLTYTTDSKPIMEVMNIDLVQLETSVAPEFVSWKDYAGSKIGLQIKYRDDLSIDDKITGMVIFSRNIDTETFTQETAETGEVAGLTHEMSISREALGQDETALSVLGVKNDDAGGLLSAGLSKSKIGSGNYDALKKVDGSVTIYYVEAGAYMFTVKIKCGNDENTLADQNLFYEMLGTMKLAGISESSLTQEKDEANDIGESQESLATGTSTTELGDIEVTGVVPVVNGVVKTPSITQENTQVVESGVIGLTQESQEADDGFTTMDSTSFKFSVQYPKSWYYSGSASSEQNVIRHYEFGTKPLEEAPGNVSLDLMTGTAPSGSTSTVNGKTVTTVSTGSGIELYVKGSGSRIYKISGPSGQQDTLLEIAGSLKD